MIGRPRAPGRNRGRYTLPRMRALLVTWVLAFAALSGASGSATATPSDAPLELQLANGAKLAGRVGAADEQGFTLRRTEGGEIRVQWKDLDAPSWLVAKRSLTEPTDGPGLLALAKFACDKALRPQAEALLAQVVRVDAALAADVDALRPRIDELRHAEADAFISRAKEMIEKKSWFQALGRFKDARELCPGSATAVNGIGEAYYYMRRLKEARAHVDEAIRIDPKCKDALLNRAWLDLLELDFTGCAKGLDAVLALPVAEGRLGTREAVLEKGRAEKIEKSEDAWKRFADEPLIAANDLRPVIQGIVDGPGLTPEFRALTDHYDLRSDVSQEYADLLAARLELIYAEYERRFGYEKTGEQKTRGKKLRFPVLVFKDRDGYAKWFERVLHDPRLATMTGGVYVPIVKHLVFFQNAKFEDTQLVAWHEGFHQYLDYFVAGAPHWFNEGQAEYFSAATMDKGGKRVSCGKTNAWRIGQLQQLLENGRLPPAADLMQCDGATFMGAQQGPESGARIRTNPSENYAASWALVHFCLEGENRRWSSQFLQYFKALCDGMPHDEAFDKAWGRVNWNNFDAAWRRHCEWLVDRARAEQSGRDVPPIPR